MRRSRKRPLTECLSENNGPPDNKRNRPSEEQRVPPPLPQTGNNNSRYRRRRGRRSVFNQSQHIEERSNSGFDAGELHIHTKYNFFMKMKKNHVIFSRRTKTKTTH